MTLNFPDITFDALLSRCADVHCLHAGEDDYEQVEKGRVKAEVEGEEAGKME